MLPILILVAGMLPLGGTMAEAARPRPIDTARVREVSTPPAVPEPTAALGFLLGIGAVAWGIRRYKSR